MILRSGNAASFLIDFPSGPPDGNITWSLLGPDGATLTGGTIDPTEGSVSTYIHVGSAFNTLDPTEMSAFRDLVWSYTINGGQVVNGERRYTLEGRVPFGVTYDGVRTKLGVEPHDLPNEEISLVKAYYDFAALTTADFADAGLTAADEFYVREAIEALAALAVLPTMQVRIAEKESSGTDTYQRQEIDWEAIGANLQAIVSSGILVILPTFDPVFGFGAVFILAPPSADPFTG